MKKVLLIAILVLFVLFAGCSDAGVSGNIVADANDDVEVLRVGAILPLSGPAVGLGEVLLEGYEWKLEEFRDEGYSIEFIVEDSKSNAKDAVIAYRKLVDRDDVKVIFTAQSSVSLALKPLAEGDEVLLWSVNAHPDFTKDSDYLIRHSNIASEDSRVIGEKVILDGNRRVGVVYQNDDWGISMRDELEVIFESNGVEVVLVGVDQTSRSFDSEVLKLIEKQVDSVIVVTVGGASGEIVSEFRESGFDGEIYSSLGLVLMPGIFDAYYDSLKGTYFHTYEKNDGFADAYFERFGEEPSLFAFLGYSDLEFLMMSVDEVGYEPLDISEHVKSQEKLVGTYETVLVRGNGDLIVGTVMEKLE